jgi:hypothetical protein
MTRPEFPASKKSRLEAAPTGWSVRYYVLSSSSKIQRFHEGCNVIDKHPDLEPDKGDDVATGVQATTTHIPDIPNKPFRQAEKG